MPRSLSVRYDLLTFVKSTLLRNGFPSQKILAEELGISQSTVSNFLNGKPVDYINFLELSRRLGQEWRDLADLEEKNSQNRSENSPNYTEKSPQKVKLFFTSSPSCRQLAYQFQESLTQAHYQIFISEKNNQVGQFLSQVDFLILFLSPSDFTSEILLEEISLTQECHQHTPQKPAIFPIGIDLSSDSPLSFDLWQYLQPLNPWSYPSTESPEYLIQEILKILKENRTIFPQKHPLAITWNKNFNNSYNVTPPKNIQEPLPSAFPEIPGGQVELWSKFYIERPPIESNCYEIISKPGALIRIKAPRQMGKTSLMARILHHAELQNSRTISLSFQLANRRIFRDSDTFLQWFCASLAQELGRLETFTKSWELAEIIGSNQCCKAYFEQFILPQVTSLTLGLDEVDRVFEFPEIADDFFGLLRALHEESKRREIWQKLRLIIVHSTEVYLPLDINKSPFNVGLPIELGEFNQTQIQELASRYGLSWTISDFHPLIQLVGGHPYLIRLALYSLVHHKLNLEQLIQESATESGIYHEHLGRHLWNLEKYPDLMNAMIELVKSNNPVRLKSELAFKLNRMGLIKIEGNYCSFRCHLYQQYFSDRLYTNPK